MSLDGHSAKDKVRDAATGVLERALTTLMSDGQLQLKGRPGVVARRLADQLQDVGLLSLTGETAIALELVASGWAPVGDDLAEATVHGIHLGGIVLSGEDDHIADYLRVVEAQHRRAAPSNLEAYRKQAHRIRTAYLDATPDQLAGRGA